MGFVMALSKLLNENVQRNDLFKDNIMLHYESGGSLKIKVCEWGCVLHTGENVESLWHEKTKEGKKKLERKMVGGN